MKKTRFKYYNKQTAIRDNDNVPSHNQEIKELKSTIITNSSVHTLIDGKIIKSLFNKNNATTIKYKWNSLLLGPVQ